MIMVSNIESREKALVFMENMTWSKGREDGSSGNTWINWSEGG